MKDGDDFKVFDRRHDREGEASDGQSSTQPDATSQAQEPVVKDEAKPSGGHGEADHYRDDVPPPPADFTALVVSLASTAYLHLGEIPDPEGKEPMLNLGVARHTIDMLAMLRDKTRGNLTKEEANILDRFLYDLRIKFVARMEHP